MTTGVTCVTEVNTVSHLFAGENHFVGVDDDNIVTTFYEGRICGFVLAAKNFRNFSAKTTKNLVSCIDNYPFLFNALGVR